MITFLAWFVVGVIVVLAVTAYEIWETDKRRKKDESR
jgi:4-hydroxybenzoate polyprenyltransferase